LGYAPSHGVVNKFVALIQRGTAGLDLRQSLAEASKRRHWLRMALRPREPQASKWCIIAARGVVFLVGLYFAAVGAFLIAAGCMSLSWGSIVAGGIIMPTALLLGWSGIARRRSNLCNPPVVFVAEFLSRICG